MIFDNEVDLPGDEVAESVSVSVPLRELSTATKEEFYSHTETEIERVEVPEWGFAVYVKAINGKERGLFEARFMPNNAKKLNKVEKRRMTTIRETLVALAVVDKVSGQRIFSSNVEIKRLGEKSAKGLNTVFDVAKRLAGLGDSDIEELEENFPEDL